jgi:hypothetical protein
MEKSIISRYDEANQAVNTAGVFAVDQNKGMAGVRTQMSIARKVTGFGKGKQNLLDQNLPVTEGVTTFDKSKLPSDKTYLVLGVKVLESADVALAVEVSNFEAVESAEMKNGSLTIKQDGQIVKLNIQECTPSAIREYFETSPFRLQGSTDVEIETAFTGNTTDGHSIKVILDVIEETSNAKVAAAASNC